MSDVGRRPILVVGGYGAFGLRVAERLARDANVGVLVAGRDIAKADAAVETLKRDAAASMSALAFDAAAPDHGILERLAPAVIINASGPFQTQDYTLARAAIAVGAHYIDLADARDFVTGIGVLDAAARAAGVLVASGASSVPAVAAAIVDHHAPRFQRLDAIEHAIVPGNSFDPGVATAASILGQVGLPFTMLVDGAWRTAYGWQGLGSVRLAGLGWRWVAPCNVPDLALFPERYGGVRTVRFSAGLEVGLFHCSMWALSWGVRLGLVGQPERLAGPLMSMKRRFAFLGSDAGGMVVRLSGIDAASRPLVVTTYLIARRNQGPYVPAIAAVVLARKLMRGVQVDPGARACLGLVTLPEFEAEVADLAISVETVDGEAV